MTGLASMLVDEYLARLRVELALAEAEDADDVVAEVRSLLAEAGGEDPDAVVAAIGRLGEPEELARGILVERGVRVTEGIPTRVWWRLGIAAPIDIAIGLSLPVAASIPILLIARIAHPSLVGIPLALALSLAALAWPFLVWRPWRRGGSRLSPGMTLMKVAIVRAPGFWRPVALEELQGSGFRPKRRVAAAVAVALVALLLLGAAAVLMLGAWFEVAAFTP